MGLEKKSEKITLLEILEQYDWRFIFGKPKQYKVYINGRRVIKKRVHGCEDCPYIDEDWDTGDFFCSLAGYGYQSHHPNNIKEAEELIEDIKNTCIFLKGR